MDKKKIEELVSKNSKLYKPVIKMVNCLAVLIGFLMIPIKWGKDKLWERKR